MKVHIIQYKWEGTWGPFRIKVPCGECSASEGIIKDVIEKEFPGEPITFEVLPWLTHWWRALLRGGWHAPIVLVNGRVISQGSVLDRGLLAYRIRTELTKGYVLPDSANVVFTKPNCSHCTRAKTMLKEKGLPYEERNIIGNPLFAHQLFALTKPLLPQGKAVTTPQIWQGGRYIGGADDLEKLLTR